ncbi:MAG: short-chain dehydrogenase/reductase [Subtercola sp.]|nr:short-chain dehydrogenase/reductase [Subtercola sp.]
MLIHDEIENGVVVVTGGGGGIGRAISREQSMQGYRIAIWDHDLRLAEHTARSVEECGGQAIALSVDVADPDQVAAATATTLSEFGSVSALVTCSGFNDFTALDELTPDRWERMMASHLTGDYLAVRALVPSMRTLGYGRIVMLSSMAGVSGSAGHVHYAAAKAGIIGFAKALCKELGPDGITVNVIAPGTIETPMIANVPDEVMRRYADNPVGRIGKPDDIAHFVSAVLSPRASFLTGAVLHINGGAYV